MGQSPRQTFFWGSKPCGIRETGRDPCLHAVAEEIVSRIRGSHWIFFAGREEPKRKG